MSNSTCSILQDRLYSAGKPREPALPARQTEFGEGARASSWHAALPFLGRMRSLGQDHQRSSHQQVQPRMASSVGYLANLLLATLEKGPLGDLLSAGGGAWPAKRQPKEVPPCWEKPWSPERHLSFLSRAKLSECSHNNSPVV